MGKISKFRKRWGLSIVQVSATALAAITVSLISTKLTGVINSLLLAGVLSVFSALFSETYKMIISATKDTVKTTVTGETDTTTDNDVDAPKETAEQDKDKEQIKKQTRKKVWVSLRRNPIFKLSVVFIVISFITVISTFLVSRAMGNDSIVLSPTVHQSQQVQLTDEQKQDIVDLTLSQIDTETSENPASSEDILTLQEEITELQNKNEQLSSLIIEYQKLVEENNTATNSRIQTLEESVDLLIDDATADNTTENDNTVTPSQ